MIAKKRIERSNRKKNISKPQIKNKNAKINSNTIVCQLQFCVATNLLPLAKTMKNGTC